jgi:hypothetical protein
MNHSLLLAIVAVALFSSNAAGAIGMYEELKLRAEIIKFNKFDAPIPLPEILPGAGSMGAIQSAEYDDKDGGEVIYHAEITWSILDALRKSGDEKYGRISKFRVAVLKYMKRNYCDMSGTLFWFRQQGLKLTYTYDFSDLGLYYYSISEVDCH